MFCICVQTYETSHTNVQKVEPHHQNRFYEHGVTFYDRKPQVFCSVVVNEYDNYPEYKPLLQKCFLTI